jgi:hypothetical protein
LGSLVDDLKVRLQTAMAVRDICRLVPFGDEFILVDRDQWSRSEVIGRRRIPFLERDGVYWGPPEDDETAIRELEGMRGRGIRLIAFASPAFWWLDYYSGLRRHLCETARCVHADERLQIFALAPPNVSTEAASSRQQAAEVLAWVRYAAGEVVGTVQDAAGRAVEQLERAAPDLLALLDWLRPSTRASWGGPLNGQRGRQALVRRLIDELKPTAVIETGTYRGTTTEFLHELADAPVYSVEVNPRFYGYAKRRLAGRRRLDLRLGDSRAFLRNLAADPTVPKERVFFYIDSHWGAAVPLTEELRIVAQAWRDPVILIDDIEVPDDPGYECLDGIGGRISMDYLPHEEFAGFEILLPELPSAEETGSPTGCIVLVERGRRDAFLATMPLRLLPD